MAIQMRRGNDVNFNATKMLPGEFAVSVDEKKVYICFSPGIVKELAYQGDIDDIMTEKLTVFDEFSGQNVQLKDYVNTIKTKFNQSLEQTQRDLDSDVDEIVRKKSEATDKTKIAYEESEEEYELAEMSDVAKATFDNIAFGSRDGNVIISVYAIDGDELRVKTVDVPSVAKITDLTRLINNVSESVNTVEFEDVPDDNTQTEISVSKFRYGVPVKESIKVPKVEKVEEIDFRLSESILDIEKSLNSIGLYRDSEGFLCEKEGE